MVLHEASLWYYMEHHFGITWSIIMVLHEASLWYYMKHHHGITWSIIMVSNGASFLAHLTQKVMWAIGITWRPSSSSVVRCKHFKKYSPLKVLDQWKPILVWIITRVSSFKIVSSDAMHQPTWPLLLKIEHMVKLQVLGNNSQTVNNIKNLTWGMNDQHSKIYLPCNFEVNLITHLGVIALFLILILFVLYFKNYKR